MIGYLKPDKMELLMKDYLYYKLYYCSICRHLVRNHIRLYSFLTGYEGTLAALLYNELVTQDCTVGKDRCSGIPIVKVNVLPDTHEAVELGAYLCMLAFQVKFQDNLMDESGFWITRYNRYFQKHINQSFAKKRAVYEKFNIDMNHVISRQRELKRLEDDTTVGDVDIYLDCWGDIFSYIMTQPFKGKIEDRTHNSLERFFRGLGKIINLLDAMADVHEDRESGQFNLILRAEPPASMADETGLRTVYEKYAGKIQRERDRLMPLPPAIGLRESLSIVNNILTHCLDNEMKKVFDFMVLRKRDRRRILFNCKDF